MSNKFVEVIFLIQESKSLIGADLEADKASTLRTLNAFAIDVIAIPSVEDLFWYVAQNVVGHLKFADCVVYQANEEQTVLTQVAALGEKNPYGREIIKPLRIPFGEGITGQTAQNRQAIIVDDLLRDQNYIPDTQPARSEICVPLIIQGRVVGVIDSEHADVDAFGDAELEVLTTVAAMTSAKLELLGEAERSNQRYGELVQSLAQLTQETTARKALEAELFNARKLETVGRLTGGFAHGFNNLLTVIAGNIELIEADMNGPDAHVFLSDAKAAADRGAKFIQSMLAFSQRMRLSPKITQLNAMVTSTWGTHFGALHQGVEFDLAPELWAVNIDPAIAEIALMNLMTNGVEAMPEGGTLRIKTENVTHNFSESKALAINLLPGPYVRLTVSDEGIGIPPIALQKVFDPFFTTKPVGEGTGLGLSLVLGFMQQSGGIAIARHTPPRGTAFDLYFPVSSSK